MKLSENTLLVTADVVGLYPSIPHKEALNKRTVQKIPTENLVKMTDFVLILFSI